MYRFDAGMQLIYRKRGHIIGIPKIVENQHYWAPKFAVRPRENILYIFLFLNSVNSYGPYFVMRFSYIKQQQ
jgi:hypothetical protein